MLSAVEVAARNNAAWCAAFCRTHGIAGSFESDHWTSARRTLPLYPDAITLTSSVDADTVLGRIDTSSPGCSVKDSFATLDLAPAGFRVLFEAAWIRRDAPVAAASGGTWSAVTEPEDLARWEHGWSGDNSTTPTFLPALLEIQSVVVFGERGEGGFSAGVVTNHAHGVVGVTDFFANGDHDEAWARCITTAARAYPDVPIVGYETGDDLDSACSQGFKALGPLRVWLMP